MRSRRRNSALDERSERIYDFRKAGKTWPEIGREIRLSGAYCAKIYKQHEAELAARPAEAPEPVETLAETTPIEKKKGRRSWAPRKRMTVRGKDPNFRYHWVRAESDDIDRRLEEGLSFVSKETGIPGEYTEPEDFGGEYPLDTSKRCRELVLMALPEEDGRARDEWIQEQTRLQTVTLKQDAEERAKERLGPGATVFGRTTIIE